MLGTASLCMRFVVWMVVSVTNCQQIKHWADTVFGCFIHFILFFFLFLSKIEQFWHKIRLHIPYMYSIYRYKNILSVEQKYKLVYRWIGGKFENQNGFRFYAIRKLKEKEKEEKKHNAHTHTQRGNLVHFYFRVNKHDKCHSNGDDGGLVSSFQTIHNYSWFSEMLTCLSFGCLSFPSF